MSGAKETDRDKRNQNEDRNKSNPDKAKEPKQEQGSTKNPPGVGTGETGGSRTGGGQSGNR